MFHFVITDQSVRMYIIMVLAAVLTGYVLAVVLLLKQKVSFEYIMYSIMLNTFFMLAGGMIYTIVAKPSLLFELSFPYIPGMSSTGAGIGMIAGTMLISLLIPFAKEDFLDSYALATPLIYALAKIGCFFAGCCEGFAYEGFLAVDYTLKSEKDGICFPVQLAETVVFFLIFVIGFVLYCTKKRKYLTVTLLILSLSAKFLLEFLRNEHVGKFVTANQIACGILLVVVGSFLLYKKNKTRHEAV